MKLKLIIIGLIITVGLQAQSRSIRVHQISGNYRVEADVLAKDTTVKNGLFLNYYKNKLIEKGSYKQNERVGFWQYFNLDGIFEYEYDYSTNRIIRLSGERDTKLATPCLFKGSPLIPHFFIAQQLFYPQKSVKDSLSGEVVLALKINKEGEVWGMYLVDKLSPDIDAAVMKVAQDFPANWQWLPATQLGKPIDGEFLITISFELTP